MGLKRRLLAIAGALFVALGILGIIVPVLPTTPFLLLAAACFARSSPAAYHWLLNNRYFGTYLRSYREGKGIPLRVKMMALAVLWLTIACSAIVVPLLLVRVVLVLIALAVTMHLFSQPTASSQPEPNPQGQEASAANDR